MALHAHGRTGHSSLSRVPARTSLSTHGQQHTGQSMYCTPTHRKACKTELATHSNITISALHGSRQVLCSALYHAQVTAGLRRFQHALRTRVLNKQGSRVTVRFTARIALQSAEEQYSSCPGQSLCWCKCWSHQAHAVSMHMQTMHSLLFLFN